MRRSLLLVDLGKWARLYRRYKYSIITCFFWLHGIMVLVISIHNWRAHNYFYSGY